jgi:hypothetical protein
LRFSHFTGIGDAAGRLHAVRLRERRVDLLALEDHVKVDYVMVKLR